MKFLFFLLMSSLSFSQVINQVPPQTQHQASQDDGQVDQFDQAQSPHYGELEGLYLSSKRTTRYFHLYRSGEKLLGVYKNSDSGDVYAKNQGFSFDSNGYRFTLYPDGSNCYTMTWVNLQTRVKSSSSDRMCKLLNAQDPQMFTGRWLSDNTDRFVDIYLNTHSAQLGASYKGQSVGTFGFYDGYKASFISAGYHFQFSFIGQDCATLKWTKMSDGQKSSYQDTLCLYKPLYQ